MNLIFLTLSRIKDINSRGIYTDLMRKFRDEGHNVYIVCPIERRYGHTTFVERGKGVTILNVRTLNIQKNSNIVEKGLGTLLLESQYKYAIKRELKGVHFDLILYSTPPITLTNVISYLKKNNKSAVSYLLLKDIFPQNAVDIGMFSRKSLMYKLFRHKERLLYQISDHIGCMSPANVDYLLKNNQEIKSDKIEVNPNSINIVEHNLSDSDKEKIREKYGLPIDKPIFIYGGNLGRPQGINFLISCLEHNKLRTDCFFLIVGSGSEYVKIEEWIKIQRPNNVLLHKFLPKTDYDLLVQSCDVGLIFLDYRFTIPNYPSRLLSYLEYKMPVLAATDPNSDIGSIAELNEYGLWCKSNNVSAFTNCVDKFVMNPQAIKFMGMNGYRFLQHNYKVENSYNQIVKYLNR